MKQHAAGFLAIVEDAKQRIQEVTKEEVRALQSGGKRFHFVDVREDHEWDQGHCTGAMHLGRGIIERDIETAIPQKDALIVLYCGGGFRSALAADNLQKMGYSQVRSMAGGFREWKEAGLPVES